MRKYFQTKICQILVDKNGYRIKKNNIKTIKSNTYDTSYLFVLSIVQEQRQNKENKNNNLVLYLENKNILNQVGYK